MSADTTAPLRKSALIVIDLANDFVFPGGEIAEAGGPEYQARAQAIIPTLKKLIAVAHQVGVTVVFATDAHNPDDYELKKWPAHSMKGTPEAGIVSDLEPEEGDLVLEKRTYSPFVSTDIDEQLKDRSIERLYIAGLHTDCCARHTAGDAFQRGYDLIWVTDALQAFTEEAHQAGLEYFKVWYATDPERQLLTAHEIIAEWTANSEPRVASV